MTSNRSPFLATQNDLTVLLSLVERAHRMHTGVRQRRHFQSINQNESKRKQQQRTHKTKQFYRHRHIHFIQSRRQSDWQLLRSRALNQPVAVVCSINQSVLHSSSSYHRYSEYDREITTSRHSNYESPPHATVAIKVVLGSSKDTMHHTPVASCTSTTSHC
jgi:hypothetical protein